MGNFYDDLKSLVSINRWEPKATLIGGDWQATIERAGEVIHVGRYADPYVALAAARKHLAKIERRKKEPDHA